MEKCSDFRPTEQKHTLQGEIIVLLELKVAKHQHLQVSSQSPTGLKPEPEHTL